MSEHATTRSTPGIGEVGLQASRNLRRFRQRASLSVPELSRACAKTGYPIPPGALHKIEAAATGGAGARRMSVDEIAALSRALHVPVTAFLAEPTCITCEGAPPAGFICSACGVGGDA